MENKKEIEENRKTITIGEAVDKKVKESLDTYKYLKNCDDKELVRMAYDKFYPHPFQKMVKCQCRNCGRILDFDKIKNPKVINDFGHFKFIKDCSYCRNNRR